MSKYLKNLLIQELSSRLEGVQDCVLANVVGMDANRTVQLRQRLREKNIHLMVVKNSLARLATRGTTLAPAFESSDGGSLAVVWGSEDFVSLVKEVTKVDKDEQFKPFETRGGVMDGEPLTADRVRDVSKWPSRQEQLSILLGQILSPGAQLSSQLIGPGGQLASQIEKKSEGGDEGQPEPATPEQAS